MFRITINCVLCINTLLSSLSGQTLRREYIPVHGRPFAVLNVGARGTKIAVFRGGSWYVDTNRSEAFEAGTDLSFNFGTAGDLPVTGDWTGVGKRCVGIFRPGGATWSLDVNCNNTLDAGDLVTPFGLAFDQPVTGDWTGDGKQKIGVYRDSYWYVDLNGNGFWDGLGIDGLYGYGLVGGNDIAIVGDWNNTGVDNIGVYRDGGWYLDIDANRIFLAGFDKAFLYGSPGQLPVVGDWRGDGTIRIGTFTGGGWYLDWNGDTTFTAGVDHAFIFGTGGDYPAVVGP